MGLSNTAGHLTRRGPLLRSSSGLILVLALHSQAVSAMQATDVPAASSEAAPAEAEAPATIETVTAADDTAPESGPDSTIVVTASRIARNGFSAPTPTTVIGVDDLEKRAATNVADVLNAIPSFGQGSTTTSAKGSITPGANLINLRALGAARTLVLVDGRRFVPSTVLGRVDLNVIPTVLIERTEVVTGGASAAWGSDAVAGVVNLIFKKKMTGVQADAQYGISDYGDNATYRASLSAGTNFANDRGNVMIAGEYEDGSGVGPASGRSQLRDFNTYIISNPGYRLGNGQPQSLLVNNVNISTATLGGLITSGPLRGTQFLPGGVPAPFVYGDLVGSQYMVGGTPIGSINQTEVPAIATALERQNVYGRLSFDVTDNVTLFTEASYARTRSELSLSIPNDLGTITIRQENPFIPASIKQQMIDQNIQSFGFGRINRDVSYNVPITVNETQRYLFGGEGKLAGNWSWSAYFQFGQNHYREDVHGNRIVANWTAAIDAVPGMNGPVCRSTLTNPNNGCVPINLFGEGSPSEAAKDYVTGTSWQDAFYKEQSAAIDINGSPFSLWAGEVSVAAGFEWRKDSVDQTVDPLSAVSAFMSHNPKALTGDINVKEVYGEIVVPLLRDQPFFQKLDLNGAIRYADYSLSGGVTSWKAGLSWDINDMIRLRGTRSRDIRAAALGELFSSFISQTNNIVDPLLGNIQYQTFVPQQGNSALKPEIADTWTAGLIVRPLRQLTASIDFYHIKIKESIGLPATIDILNGCYVNNNATFCSLITRDPGTGTTPGRISQILRTYVNQGDLTTQGFDAELSYATPLSDWSSKLDGTLSLRLLATYVDKLTQVTNGITAELAGVVGTGGNGIPHWRWNASASYSRGPLDLFSRAATSVAASTDRPGTPRHLSDPAARRHPGFRRPVPAQRHDPIYAAGRRQTPRAAVRRGQEHVQRHRRRQPAVLHLRQHQQRGALRHRRPPIFGRHQAKF